MRVTARTRWKPAQARRIHHEDLITTTPGKENDARRWVQQLGAARIAWSNLTVEELRRCAGDAGILAGLIQARYGVSLENAHCQVEEFFARSRRFFTVDESWA